MPALLSTPHGRVHRRFFGSHERKVNSALDTRTADDPKSTLQSGLANAITAHVVRAYKKKVTAVGAARCSTLVGPLTFFDLTVCAPSCGGGQGNGPKKKQPQKRARTSASCASASGATAGGASAASTKKGRKGGKGKGR